MNLTDEQTAAVLSNAPRLALIAGAGTGKTTTLIARVARMIRDGAHPHRLLVTTFTRAAAAHVRARLAHELDADALPHVCTVHSMCARLINDHPELAGRMRGLLIYDEHTADSLVRYLARTHAVAGADKAGTRAKLLKHVAVQNAYSSALREGNAVDYDELERLALRVALRTTDRVHYDHILVDEAQDLSALQWEILQALGRPHTTYCLIGDPRQAIYGWRGGEAGILTDLALSTPDAVELHLTASHRFGGDLARLANDLHPTYPALSGNTPGRVHCSAQEDEATWIARSAARAVALGEPPNAIAILGRTWSSLWRLREAMHAESLRPHVLNAKTDPWVSAPALRLAWWLLLHTAPHDPNLPLLVAGEADTRTSISTAHRERRALAEVMAARGVIPTLRPDLSTAEAARAYIDHTGEEQALDRLLPRLQGWRASFRGFRSWWTFGRAPADRLAELQPDEIPLMTIHGAKGLEWPRVYVCGVTSHAFRDEPEQDDRNVLYVACTRARAALAITRPSAVPLRSGALAATHRSPLLPRSLGER